MGETRNSMASQGLGQDQCGSRDDAGLVAAAALAPLMVTVSADDLVLAFRAAGNVQATEEQYEAAERLFVAARTARATQAKALGGDQ